MKHVFGPVPSRRLGRSLGVDIVPFKTCSYDCIYCQLGRTTCKSLQRQEWAEVEAVLDEMPAALAARPDYVTLSGSGEPTLYSRMGELIERIKAMTDVPVAVLTNGSLLWQQDVRRQLTAADLVVPSLDAGDEATFQAVNRPHPDLSFERMLEGLVEFRREFGGQYWLEVFLLAGYTDTPARVADMVRCVDLIRPDRVQLNTVERPPAEGLAVAVPRERMREMGEMFNPPGELLGGSCSPGQPAEFHAGREDILNMLRRRPCSIEDIAAGLAMHPNEVIKHVGGLTAAGLLSVSRVGGKVYYKPAENAPPGGPDAAPDREARP